MLHTGYPGKNQRDAAQPTLALFFFFCAREKQDLSSEYMFYHFLMKEARFDVCDLYKVKKKHILFIFSLNPSI